MSRTMAHFDAFLWKTKTWNDQVLIGEREPRRLTFRISRFLDRFAFLSELDNYEIRRWQIKSISSLREVVLGVQSSLLKLNSLKNYLTCASSFLWRVKLLSFTSLSNIILNFTYLKCIFISSASLFDLTGELIHQSTVCQNIKLWTLP